MRRTGWSGYAPLPSTVAVGGTLGADGRGAPETLRPEIADVGRLVRRGLHAVVLDELLDTRNAMTRTLLGSAGSAG